MLQGPVSLCLLTLETTKAGQLALLAHDSLGGVSPEGADQPVLQVDNADIEAETMHVLPGIHPSLTEGLESPEKRRFLSLVAQAGNRLVVLWFRSMWCAMFVAPLIGTIDTPSAPRSRPSRRANLSRATRSLSPSTSSTARGREELTRVWQSSADAHPGRRGGSSARPSSRRQASPPGSDRCSLPADAPHRRHRRRG